VPPATVFAYAEGGTYSVHVEHPLGRLLIQSSAGYVKGALAGYPADVVLLGIGALGRSDAQYKDEYFAEVVEAVGARRVIPIHYDDFLLPLAGPLRANPLLFDDVTSSLDCLLARAERSERLAFHMLREWTRVVLFPERGPDAKASDAAPARLDVRARRTDTPITVRRGR